MENIKEIQEETYIRKILSKEAVGIIAVLSIAFGVFTFIMNPQQSNKEQISYLKSEVEKNQSLNDTLTKTQQNDLHTLEGRMNTQEDKIEELTTAVVELKTIINERIPAKK